MASNIELSWTNPADTSDINSFKVYRFYNENLVYNTQETATAEEAAVFAQSVEDDTSGNSKLVDTITNFTETTSFQDLAVESGSWAYGVFSFNEGGLGPGTIATLTF
jgi:hypothetical protein